ncbi:MAG: metalloregulator ArsR/SmtB family transcription factor [bacterium]|nr:metalloregulator ArsR/SmtB family transcription factor [bacterium]
MDVTQVYKAMSDETRLRILHALNLCSLNVQELQKVIGVGQSNISHHLKILENAGILKHKSEGTANFYHLPQNEDSLASNVTSGFISIVGSNLNGLTKILLRDKESVNNLIEKRREAARAYFDSVAPKWKEIREEIVNSRSYLKNIQAEISDDGTLLEMGCGSGILLAELLPRKGETIGVDYSPAMLEEAKQNLALNKVDLRLGYLEHLPVPDSSIDIALCHMVLHHLDDPKNALADSLRVLKPSGKLLVVDLTSHANENMRERYADRWLGFDPKDFKIWLESLHFKNIEISILGENNKVFLIKGMKT